MEKRILVLIGMIFIVLTIAKADFGQTAGVLDFGKLTIGENKTLSYMIINTGETELLFSMNQTGDIFVAPENGVLPPHSQQIINVTAIGEQEGSYSGKVWALGVEPGEGAVKLQVQMEKDYVYSVVPESMAGTAAGYLFLGIAITFLIFFALMYSTKKRRKKI